MRKMMKKSTGIFALIAVTALALVSMESAMAYTIDANGVLTAPATGITDTTFSALINKVLPLMMGTMGLMISIVCIALAAFAAWSGKMQQMVMAGGAAVAMIAGPSAAAKLFGAVLTLPTVI